MTVPLPILDVISRNFPEASEEYKKFALQKDQCRACSIYNCYSQVSQAEGQTSNPTFMFVGESPGADEIEENRPFIGAAGQRLRTELKKYPEIFNKKTTLISNVVACRPQNNKFPDQSLAQDCYDLWLSKEIALVKPKIIIALGNQPLKYLRKEAGITSKRGTWKYEGNFGAWTFATYHPSYVIRCERSKDLDVIKNFEADFAELVLGWENKTQTGGNSDFL